eukprot:500404-Prymnesium_polylepis.1
MQDGIFPGRGGMHYLPRLRLHSAQAATRQCMPGDSALFFFFFFQQVLAASLRKQDRAHRTRPPGEKRTL